MSVSISGTFSATGDTSSAWARVAVKSALGVRVPASYHREGQAAPAACSSYAKEVKMSAINQLQQECVRFQRRTYTPSRCRARVVAKSAQLRFRLRRKLRSLPCSSFPHKVCDFAGTPGWGCCALRARWGLRPQTPAPPPESDTRCASVTFRRGQYPTLEGGAFLRQFFTVQSKSSSGARASPLWPLPPIGVVKSW